MSRLAWFLLPLILFLTICVFLFKGLYSDPMERESEVLAEPFPAFSLPDLMDETIIYDNSIFDGQITVVNVWGVWCITCAIELPYLTQLSQEGIRFVGLYYDQDIDPDFGIKTVTRVRTEVNEMLSRTGNPFEFNIFDVYRDTSLDLGVTGAPETFLVDENGVIRVHHLGDVNERVWAAKFKPVLDELQGVVAQPVVEELASE
ncbi:redoxin family protein [Glaciecola sp. XM2]|uniref:redoxin family protein n=1 Tax=Glaciecola sp. XM2 TaxID=1914931 RepID=UPI001BDF2B57|nr:redoxin family protein [Glaciecola sp. XM2]MBT1450684.1 redoxin family protein [Glaciecola sp. XM2]